MTTVYVTYRNCKTDSNYTERLAETKKLKKEQFSSWLTFSFHLCFGNADNFYELFQIILKPSNFECIILQCQFKTNKYTEKKAFAI